MYFGYTDCFIVIGSLIALIIWYGWNRNQAFKKNGINALNPYLYFGNILPVILGKKHVIDVVSDAHNNFPNDKYVGIFNFMTPTVIVNDLDLIRQITVKDFDHFVDHMKFTDENVDPLLSKILFSLDGEKWKEMRNTLSPAFTGSKMRGMFPFVIECAEKLVDYLKSEADQPSYKRNGYIEFDTKDLVTRYTNDVIASCAFGYKVDSYNDRMNMFYKMATNSTKISTFEMLKLFLYLFCPKLVQILKLGAIQKESTVFFRNLILENIYSREKHKIIRPDMIHMLLLAKQGSLKFDDNEVNKISVQENNNEKIKSTKFNWSDDELAAQALVFLFAGLDSTSNVISFLFHELAININVQNKLQKEIDSFIKENNGIVKYSNINTLKYLDMVITETLRMYPVAPFLDRVCTKSYTLPPQNNNSTHGLTLKKGDIVWIPAYNIQRDPKYYNNPDQFIPERFSDEINAISNTATYLSFGMGPRACIGSRFASMEIKTIAIYVLANFNIVPTPKLQNPVKIKPHLFDVLPEKGFWIGFKKRDVLI